jgi:hypothetical protein
VPNDVKAKNKGLIYLHERYCKRKVQGHYMTKFMPKEIATYEQRTACARKGCTKKRIKGGFSRAHSAKEISNAMRGAGNKRKQKSNGTTTFLRR